MNTNTTSFNIEFHDKYKNDTIDGIRVPIDDRGASSSKDRPFAMGSNSVDWEKGSANRAVKAMWDINGGSVDVADQYNYDNGLMDIKTMNRYVFRQSLWGSRGDARSKTPNDLMSFRGYPTPIVGTVRFLNAEMNQDTVETQNTLNESVYCTSDVIPFQTRKEFGQSFPITLGADYVMISGVVSLIQKVPFNSIFLELTQELFIEDLNTGLTTDKMFSGEFGSSDFPTSVECYSDGSGLNYYFRFYAEITNGNLDDGNYADRVIKLKFGENTIGKAKDDGIYVDGAIFNIDEFNLNVTWNGSKWISSEEIILDNERPSPPDNIVLISEIRNVVKIGWDASIDNIGIKHYVVYISKTDGSYYNSIITKNLETSFRVDLGQSYEFTVRAVDLSGNESFLSNVLSFTSTPFVLAIVYASNIGFSSSNAACSSKETSGYPETRLFVSDSDSFLDGFPSTVYTDKFGEFPFNGNDKWWVFTRFFAFENSQTKYYAIKVNSFGVVKGYNPCVIN